MTEPSSIDATLRWRCTDLLYHEADLLDDQRFEDWLELFTPDAVYWLPIDTARNEPDNGLNLIYDDYDKMCDRVRRLRTGYALSEEPLSRTVHLVGNVVPIGATDAVGMPNSGTEVTLRSRLFLRRARRTGIDQLAANCTHRLVVPSDGPIRIQCKRVDLVDADRAQPSLSFII
jgi:benzoate/toluate 1,2-dioxygenase beta subunit